LIDSEFLMASVKQALTLPRTEAERRLRGRIDQAKEINTGRIRSGDELTAAEEREKKWYAFNVAMLVDMFTTDDYAYEYKGSRTLVHFGGDSYNDVGIADYERRVIETIRSQVASLDSIAERLQFAEEPTTGEAKGQTKEVELDRTKVFVVHGHDEGAHQGVARFLETIELKPIILHEQPNRGLTIIEKFVDHAREVGFAVVLLTPDDLGGAAATDVQQSRARQNVIFELGYFVASLGRGRVCLLRKGDVDIPSDLYGVVYTAMDSGSGWKIELVRELKAAGLDFDPGKVVE
jgi:predicted nucleotide-binding protein